MFATRENPSPWSKAPRAVIRRLFLDRQASFWMNELAPLHAGDQCRARIVSIVDETPDTKTFVLQPNFRFRGHEAGQYVSVEVEVDGVRTSRCYSISSPPGAEHLTITVRRVPDGRVSSWLHEHSRPGDVLRLGPATGDFVLPAVRPEKLLFLSGGSGITPLMSMARTLAAQGNLHDVVWVHYARSQKDVIFGAELQQLAREHVGLRLVLCLDDAPGAPRGFDEGVFSALVPDFAKRAAFLCGPGPLMERVEALFDTAGASAQLKREAFVSAIPTARMVAPGEPVEVKLLRSERAVIARGAGSLLEQLERAGTRPPSGCRVGICHTCKCTKQSGTVENLLTGVISSAPDEEIQLCISKPHSDLALDLG
jgi:ferredoxin-NADP reductase